MLFSWFFVHFYDLLWPSAASALRLWIDEKDYDEFGPTLVHERCFWIPSDHEDFPSPEVDTTADHEDFWVLELIQLRWSSKSSRVDTSEFLLNSCWLWPSKSWSWSSQSGYKVRLLWNPGRLIFQFQGSKEYNWWLRERHPVDIWTPWIPFSDAGRAEKSLQSLQSLQVIGDMNHDETRVKNHKEIILIFKSWGVPFNAKFLDPTDWSLNHYLLLTTLDSWLHSLVARIHSMSHDIHYSQNMSWCIQNHD